MKKHILIFAFGLLISTSSCSNSSKTTDKTQDSVATETIQEETPKVETEIKEEKAEVTETDYSNQETFVNVYRSDGFRPNMVSEWVQIRTNSDMSKILEVLYWNVQDEKKVKLEIVSQEYSDGEISGYTGEVRFPNDSEIIGFGMIEDRFNLSPKDGKMQEFTYEEK